MSAFRALVCGLLVIVSSRAVAQDYEIKFTRPVQPGYAYELVGTATVTQNMRVSRSGQAAGEENSTLQVDLKGTVIVIEVDETMRPTTLSLTIESCKISQSGKEEVNQTVDAGTEVLAQLRDGKEEFLLNNEPATALMVKVFDLFISVTKSESTDDEAFGTTERKKVGDRWPVNAKAVAAEVSKAGAPLDENDVTGFSIVEKLTTVNGAECLRLAVLIETDKLLPPLPAGLRIEKSQTKFETSGDYPVNVGYGRRTENRNMTMNVTASGKLQANSPSVRVDLEVSEKVQQQLKPLAE